MANLIPALVFDPVGLLLDGFGLVERGGPVMYVLLALSVVALAIIGLKLWQFTKARLGALGFVDSVMAHIKAGRIDDAELELRAVPNPIARVLEESLAAALEPGLAAEDREARVARAGSTQIRKLEGGLRTLEIIGNLSPLLGLLGTVMGMIAAFAALEAAGAKIQPGLLAGGIWERSADDSVRADGGHPGAGRFLRP
jgi:biopolymer transport protein ExbB